MFEYFVVGLSKCCSATRGVREPEDAGSGIFLGIGAGSREFGIHESAGIRIIRTD